MVWSVNTRGEQFYHDLRVNTSIFSICMNFKNFDSKLPFNCKANVQRTERIYSLWSSFLNRRSNWKTLYLDTLKSIFFLFNRFWDCISLIKTQ